MYKRYIEIKQNNFVYYCINLSVDELLSIYTIEFYKSEPNSNGYQRLPKKNHYMKLVKYITENERPILVPALIGAINYNDVDVYEEYIRIKDKIRIVDGQHRIEAFKYVKSNFPKKYETLKNQEFLIELMVINKDEKYIEVSTFIDINSKNKKVDLDLAIQLKHTLINKENIEKGNIDTEALEFCSTEIMNNLNKDQKSVWYNLIKVGNDLDKKIISSKAFQRSIIDIVKVVFHETLTVDLTIEKSKNIINICWEIIEKRWPKCFIQPFNYNIQKGIGVFPFHMIISEIIKAIYDKQGSINEESFKTEFESIINEAIIKESNWEIGETLSKYNSKAGFSFIKDVIEGKERLENNEKDDINI